LVAVAGLSTVVRAQNLQERPAAAKFILQVREY